MKAKSHPRPRATRLGREDRVAGILAAARTVIAEHGYEAALLADVAARADVVEGTIYRYFESKRDLFIHVAESWFEEILGEHEPARSVSGTLNRLRFLIWRELSIIRQEPALTRFVLMELRPDPAYRSMRLYDLNRKFTSAITSVVQDAIDSGEFRSGVPIQLVRDMIFGAIEHQTWAYLRNEGDFPLDSAAEHLAGIVYRGMAADPGQGEGAGVAGRIERAVERLEVIIATKR